MMTMAQLVITPRSQSFSSSLTAPHAMTSIRSTSPGAARRTTCRAALPAHFTSLGMGVGRIFPRGATAVKFHLIDSKLKEKHLSTEKLIEKYQIFQNPDIRGSLPPPFDPRQP